MRLGPRHVVAAVVGLLLITCATNGVESAEAAATPSVKLTLVAQLMRGTALAARADDSALYIAEQNGTVRALRNGKLVRSPVADLTAHVSQDGGERGLLGLAFSPDGKFLYVDYTDRAGNTQIVELAMQGRKALVSSRRSVLTVNQPQPNHNGGQLTFGPDGMLYIALGDGGGGGDTGAGHRPGGNAQSLATLLGKILRIDPTPLGTATYTVPTDNPFVGQAGALPEIWAYGLRNPWRFTFDSRTGDLWIGDVGQNAWEEIDRAPATGGRNAGRGSNFGWNRLEGTHTFSGAAPANDVLPVFEYPHNDGSCSVTGGYVYRGRAIPALRGMYLFADYCRGELRALAPDGNGGFTPVNLGITTEFVSTFGQRDDGELFVLSQSDGLFRVVAG